MDKKLKKSMKKGARYGAVYGLALSHAKGDGFNKTGFKRAAVTSTIGAGVGAGVHSWKNGRSPAQGKARSPNFSSSHTASGFKWGVKMNTHNSNTAVRGFAKGHQKP